MPYSEDRLADNKNSNLASSIEKACEPTKAWGGHTSNFPEIVDNVVGYDVGYEEETRARLD